MTFDLEILQSASSQWLLLFFIICKIHHTVHLNVTLSALHFPVSQPGQAANLLFNLMWPKFKGEPLECVWECASVCVWEAGRQSGINIYVNELCAFGNRSRG